jgi:hypothetical protein
MARRLSMPAPAQLLERPAAVKAAQDVVWPREVVIHESAVPLMTAEVVDVLAEFVDLFIKDARSRRVDFDKLELRGTFDPEDDSEGLFVRLWVRNMTDDERHDYFAEFGGRAQEWFDALVDRRKEVFIKWISFIVWPVRNAQSI